MENGYSARLVFAQTDDRYDLGPKRNNAEVYHLYKRTDNRLEDTLSPSKFVRFGPRHCFMETAIEQSDLTASLPIMIDMWIRPLDISSKVTRHTQTEPSQLFVSDQLSISLRGTSARLGMKNHLTGKWESYESFPGFFRPGL